MEIERYIWNSVCVPTLKYGLETMYLSNNQLQKLGSIEGTLLQSSLGLSVHSHHSKLIRPMNIVPVGEIVKMWFVVCGIEFVWSTLRCEIYAHTYIVSGIVQEHESENLVSFNTKSNQVLTN